MHYRQWAPDPLIAAFVDCWWVIEGAGTGEPQAILPDGTAELIFHFEDAFEQLDAGSAAIVQPRTLMAGQLSRALTIRPGASVCTIGVRLKAAAARAISGAALNELTDRVVELRDLNPRFARAAARATAAPSLERCLEDLGRALVEALAGAAIDPATARAVEAIERSGGCAPIDRVCGHTGLSGRDLERRFARDVGLSPKAFSRVIRFQRAVHAIESGETRLIEAALTAGYYDQPHFTREFTAIAGTPPSSWIASDQELARYFTRTSRERRMRPPR